MSIPKLASCVGCPLYGNGQGFVNSDGTGENGVLLVLEAGGEQEAAQGLPVCLEENSLVLLADLTWKPLKDIQIGDKVIGCDDASPFNPHAGISKHMARKFQVATVTGTYTKDAPCFLVRTLDGELTATGDHKVLTRGSTNRAKWLTVDKLSWRNKDYSHTNYTRKTDRCSSMAFIGKPWECLDNYTAGWLGGFLDGEGCVHQKPKGGYLYIGWSQNEGPVANRARMLTTELGFGSHTNGERRTNGVTCIRERIKGNFHTQLLFLGITRPYRLIHNFMNRFEARGGPAIRPTWSKVLDKVPVGMKRVVDIQTTTGTFIANGFIVHNCGKAGYFLFSQLKRIDLERDSFRIDNTCKCRPPNNKLIPPSRDAAIAHCAPNLDATIHEMQELCARSGKHFTILTLGDTALRRVLRITDPRLTLTQHLSYVFWSEEYQAFVIPSFHPSFLQRGNSHLVPILQFAAKRAVEIADHGFTYHQPNYLRDPDPATFAQWIRDYTQYAVQDQQCYLAFDIETPHKQGKDEEEVAREDDDDYTILRCSFAYKAGEAVSVPWRAEYIPYIEELFAGVGTKLVWNANYDVPRITAQMPIHGDIYDGMLMWHVLNSALPKGLGFVSPFYSQDMPMWKHTSKEDPAGYNCQDSDALLRNVLGIKPDLEKNGLWKVFERHVVQLNRVLSYMSSKGVLRDEVMRQDAEVKLSALLDETEKQMDASVPQEARRLHPKNGYKKTPKDTTGLVSLRVRVPVRRCAVCGLESPKKSHFAVPKSSKKPPNPCGGAGIVEGVEEVERFAKALEFKVSKVGLEGYQRVLKHQAIVNRHENRVTFDESAIEQLMKRYPKDKLYPLILQNRSYSKLISTYVGETIDGVVRGGMPIGRDGHIHTSYSHNPSTLRLASQSPNLQNLPRTSNGVGDVVRNLIVASPGCILKELDFNAIEAVLVGFFACDPTYIRLSKLGIHSYLASHILGRPADLKWSDEDLAKYFLEIKKAKDDATKLVYNGAKRGIHLTGYGGTPHKMHQAEPEVFKTIKEAERLQGIYFELFPSIKKWQYSTRLQAEKDGYLRNPFSYIHRFYRVFRYTKVGKDWKKEPDAAGDGNKVLAFLPQSTAAGIIKEVMLRLYFDYFEEAGQYMRLQVHDSLVNEIPIDLQDQVTEIIYREMTRPVPELRLSASYGMGDALSIGVDIKSGYRWGEVH